MAVSSDETLWDSKKGGEYFQVSEEHFTDRIAALPDFPRPVRIPTKTGGRAHPRWYPSEVKAYAERYQH